VCIPLAALNLDAFHSVTKPWDDQARRSRPNECQLNRAQSSADVIALVVLWRLRYKLSLRDLAVSRSW
jgi:hypothetical protein